MLVKRYFLSNVENFGVEVFARERWQQLVRRSQHGSEISGLQNSGFESRNSSK